MTANSSQLPPSGASGDTTFRDIIKSVPHDVQQAKWKTLIKNTTVLQLIPDQQVIYCVDKHDSVLTVLQILAAYSILCCPIYDPDTNKILGLIDILDLVRYISRRYLGTISPDPKSQELARVELFSQPVEVLFNISERNWWFEVKEDTPLEVVFSALSNADLKRAVIFANDRAKMTGIVTQFDIVRWIDANLRDNLKIEDYIIKERFKVSHMIKYKARPTETVYQMLETDPVTKAFDLMYDLKISAFPIVSAKDQTLVGTISASDLKGILAAPDQIFDVLKLSCVEWIQLSKCVDKKLNIVSTPLPTQIVCYPEENIVDVLDRLVAFRVHRLWVVNKQFKVIDVISLCDIINAFNNA